MKLTPTEPDVRTIVDRIDRGDIDLQPDFQRQEVWSSSKKKRLIDTILRGWSIPPVHLVETSESRLEVLDGQQRLASVRDFLHNKFSIDGRITPIDDNITRLHGKFYRQLDPSTRRRVDQYALRCFRISDYNPEEPSELFYRLNQPTMLTAGEQRNALFGPARQQLKYLVGAFEDFGNGKETLGFSNLRLAYDDVLARLLYFIEAGSFGAKSTEARISERFRDREPFPSSVYDRAHASIEIFSKCREEASPYRFNKASLLSWLLFFSRFYPAYSVDFKIIQLFIEATQGIHLTRGIGEVVSVFEDRASLRVTDVSSVVYRDFSLCYIYHFISKCDLPDEIPVNVIENVERAFQDNSHFSFEHLLADYIDIEQWSSTL